MADIARTAVAAEQMIKSALRRIEWPDRELLKSSYHQYSNWTHGISVLAAFTTELLHPLAKTYLNCTFWLLIGTSIAALAFVVVLAWRKIKTELAVTGFIFCVVTGALSGALLIILISP
jgi:hypothetical protein